MLGALWWSRPNYVGNPLEILGLCGVVLLPLWGYVSLFNLGDHQFVGGLAKVRNDRCKLKTRATMRYLKQTVAS